MSVNIYPNLERAVLKSVHDDMSKLASKVFLRDALLKATEIEEKKYLGAEIGSEKALQSDLYTLGMDGVIAGIAGRTGISFKEFKEGPGVPREDRRRHETEDDPHLRTTCAD